MLNYKLLRLLSDNVYRVAGDEVDLLLMLLLSFLLITGAKRMSWSLRLYRLFCSLLILTLYYCYCYYCYFYYTATWVLLLVLCSPLSFGTAVVLFVWWCASWCYSAITTISSESEEMLKLGEVVATASVLLTAVWVEEVKVSLVCRDADEVILSPWNNNGSFSFCSTEVSLP